MTEMEFRMNDRHPCSFWTRASCADSLIIPWSTHSLTCVWEEDEGELADAGAATVVLIPMNDY